MPRIKHECNSWFGFIICLEKSIHEFNVWERGNDYRGEILQKNVSLIKNNRHNGFKMLSF